MSVFTPNGLFISAVLRITANPIMTLLNFQVFVLQSTHETCLCFFLLCSNCPLFSFKNYQHCKSTPRKVFCLFVCFFLSRVIEGSNNPEWERWAYLVHSDSQSEHRISIRLILPSGAGSHMIMSVII